jgi:hypothetical protein
MTAVFARSDWKYPSPRSYRDVLLEAGHFCQTFCLVATSLGLAPFCTAALADSIIEADLGINGFSEYVIYGCGAGTRPENVDWAPSPDTDDVPARVRGTPCDLPGESSFSRATARSARHRARAVQAREPLTDGTPDHALGRPELRLQHVARKRWLPED